MLSSKSRDKSFTSDFSKEASNNIGNKNILDKRKINDANEMSYSRIPGTNKIQKEKP